jgi:hypothetical protein
MIGATIYDLRDVNRKRRLELNPNSRQLRRRPLITAIVPTENDESSIEDCLESLVKNNYRKLEIIIIDNASSDKTKAIVRQFIDQHPKKSIRLVARRTSKNMHRAMANSTKRYCTGDLVLELTPKYRIDKHALQKAVSHFNSQAGIQAVSFNCRVASISTSAGLFQQLEYLVRFRSKKLAELLAGNNAGEAGPLLVQRQLRLKMWNQQIYPAVHYVHDARLYVPSVKSTFGLIKQRYNLQLYRLKSFQNLNRRLMPVTLTIGLVATLLPLVLGYFLYLALRLQQPSFLLISWALLSGWLLLAIWDDEYLRLRQKTGYSLFVPATFLVFCILTLIQPIVMLRGLLPARPVVP